MTPRLGAAALSALVLAVVAGPAQAAPGVFAHRGGAYVNGKLQVPDTLPAFGVARCSATRRRSGTTRPTRGTRPSGVSPSHWAE